tara:strand:+ start:986 stop:1168 length:183 start_codon:yes stop_codon:yes gene_type:complete
MKQIKVTQVKSEIGSSSRQKANLIALGLHGRGKCRIHETTPDVMGMVEKVKHLIKVEKVQ